MNEADEWKWFMTFSLCLNMPEELQSHLFVAVFSLKSNAFITTGGLIVLVSQTDG